MLSCGRSCARCKRTVSKENHAAHWFLQFEHLPVYSSKKWHTLLSFFLKNGPFQCQLHEQPKKKKKPTKEVSKQDEKAEEVITLVHSVHRAVGLNICNSEITAHWFMCRCQLMALGCLFSIEVLSHGLPAHTDRVLWVPVVLVASSRFHPKHVFNVKIS